MNSFYLVPLGVHGGDVDGDRSAFLLSDSENGKALCLDGGSIFDGMIRWGRRQGKIKASDTWNRKTSFVRRQHRKIESYFLTHSHLDHISGFALRSFYDFHRFQKALGQGKKWSGIPVYGNSHLIKSLKEDLLNGRVWVSLWKKPFPVYRLGILKGWVKSGPFEVSQVLLTHGVPCSAFLVRRKDGGLYAHLGDTGPTDKLWKVLIPYLREGKLKAITLEMSFPSTMEKLCKETAHLSPSLVLKELGKLTGVTWKGSPKEKKIQELARALGGVKIFVYHIKPETREEVLKEIKKYKSWGMPLMVLKQGVPVTF